VKLVILLQTILITSSYFTPSNISTITWTIIVNSKLHELILPYENTFKYWSTKALEIEPLSYREAILTYYNLIHELILHNRIEESSKYLAIMLTLILKVKGYSEDLGSKLIQTLDKLDWAAITIYNDDPKEIIDYWLNYNPKSVEDFALTYVSICLSLIEKLPVNSFIRILFTPKLREMYFASLIAIIATSAYFVAKRASEELGGVKYEGYR